MPDISTLIVLAACALTIFLFVRFLPVPKCVGPSPSSTQENDLEPTQDEVDLWVDVFKMQLKKDTSVMAAAETADRAVRQFNTRYGDNGEDEDDI